MCVSAPVRALDFTVSQYSVEKHPSGHEQALGRFHPALFCVPIVIISCPLSISSEDLTALPDHTIFVKMVSPFFPLKTRSWNLIDVENALPQQFSPRNNKLVPETGQNFSLSVFSIRSLCLRSSSV